MGSSTTTRPATGDDAPAPRPGVSSSQVLRFVAKLVLGVAGFAGFALLGAGGAWLFKHYVASAPGAATPAAQVAPAARARPEVASPAPLPAPSAALPVAPAVVALPAASAPALEAAPPVAALPEHDLTVGAPTAAGPATFHSPARPAHVDAHAHAATAHADRAACQARVNAITADLSLRNEPPTPEQLAILKRGCK